VTDWGIVARAVHIAAVVVWIGGVWLVTTAVLPQIRQKPAPEVLREFEAVERRFAPQARVAVLLVLLSGLYMLYDYDLWDRFTDSRFWWMHLMVGVWLVFGSLLFVIEPVMGRRGFHDQAKTAPEAMLARILWMHRVLLVLSMMAILAAAAGSHGLF
jgi:uncharacterized membrane protein